MPYNKNRRFKKKRFHRKNRTGHTPYGKQVGFYRSKKFAMYRSPRMIMPQEYITTLRFGDNADHRLIGDFTYLVEQFRSDPYDVAQGAGTLAIPGFTELAAIYNAYRPLRFGYKIIVVNNEDFPVNMTVFMTKEQITGSTRTNIFSVGNPLTKTATMAAKGGMDKVTLKANHSLVEVSGTRAPLFADDWTGLTQGSLTGTTLSNAIWMSAFVDQNSAGTSAGVSVTLELAITVQFFQMRFLAS